MGFRDSGFLYTVLESWIRTVPTASVQGSLLQIGQAMTAASTSVRVIAGPAAPMNFQIGCGSKTIECMAQCLLFAFV